VKRSRRLQTLVKLVQLAERGAREQLAQANHELLRREQQCRQLEGYDAEYAARWLDSGRRGVDGAELARLGAFRASLASTLAIQERAVEAAREQAAQSATRWSATRDRLRTFEDLVERTRAAESREAERREQNALDDLPPRREPGAAD
jgi:flagellar export protein FliJ